MTKRWIISPSWVNDTVESTHGKVPVSDNGSIDSTQESWKNFSYLINKSVTSGKTFKNELITTYTLVYTVSTAYIGGVLDPNGNIHFVPRSADRGQKITTFSALPFELGTCLSSYLNKF